MTGQENVEALQRWIAAYNDRDMQAEAAARTPDFVAHVPGATALLDGDGWAGFIAGFAAAFPELRLTIEDRIADENMAAARVTFRGTHRGEFQGIAPTGREVTFSSIELNRMKHGKIAEHWVELDLMGLLQQLGAFPTPGPVER